jgi:hypothetical protein
MRSPKKVAYATAPAEGTGEVSKFKAHVITSRSGTIQIIEKTIEGRTNMLACKMIIPDTL